MFMTDKVGDLGTFPKKLDALVAGGYLGKQPCVGGVDGCTGDRRAVRRADKIGEATTHGD